MIVLQRTVAHRRVPTELVRPSSAALIRGPVAKTAPGRRIGKVAVGRTVSREDR
ncbi:hypothetical protein MMMB2_2387 [Mycobacterium marinum MB2]|nr:hypothetical protein MMSP_2247 [Mycobacterium sp. 012931]EPQ77725.1 hypothetical protein MMMB2_2387 [Mycobacterium marinum MB2]MBC9861468.1 hypothetical protein [Mycobacterium pseudoshottsii]